MSQNKKKGYKSMKEITIKGVTIGSGMPKICVPIVKTKTEEILEMAKKAEESVADVVEWRGDFWEQCSDTQALEELLSRLQAILKTKPLLFTIRTKGEGGQFDEGTQAYVQLVKTAAKVADLVDVEIFMNGLPTKEVFEEIHKEGCKIVASNHDFFKTPKKEEILRRLQYMQQENADIAKIAVMPESEKDVLTLLEATEEMTANYADRPIVTMSMKGMGAISRIAGETFGSAMTFGSLEEVSAPGQLELSNLKTILEIMHNSKEK